MTTPVSIPDAYDIPGAILFMTITFKEGATIDSIKIVKGKQDMNIVAYDPNYTSTETLSAMQTRYATNGLPYFERFSHLGDGATKFQTPGTGGVYFSK